jgi:pyruvate dehydrogenase E2 component (dihydrolipoamide acetyltransferase)
MPTEFRMPALGADMEAGTLVQWLKQPGDPVARGDIIAVVDTEKGAIEIEAFQPGVLDRVVVATGQKVPVGTVLALIRREDEPASDAPAAERATTKASPGTRRVAAALGIDLSGVTGTGPEGSITREDVERAAAGRRTAPPAPAAAPASPDKGAAMRHAIAASMSRAKREIPHLYLSSTIDVTGALAWIAAENAARPVERRLLLIALLVKAVARAAAEVPGLNGTWVDGAFRPGAGVHVGCAIALRDGGLVAPALHDADRLTLDVTMGALLDLVARARAGALRSSELADATITVTNLGELGVEAAFAIINPPQVAIVAFGRPVERPWVVDGRIAPRTVLSASLSADHRATDGRRAGQFLAAVERHLQRPEAL